MMEIPPTNVAYCSLRALAHVASQRKINVLFFVWPLNKEDLTAIGTMDEAAFARSTELIREMTEGEYTHFIDLSDVLRHGDFADFYSHSTVRGRRKIAEALAPEVLEILQDNSHAD